MKHEDGMLYLNTWDLIKRFFKSKTEKPFKEKRSLDTPAPDNNGPTFNSEVNHIAVILDGEVQEILRAQNRLSALLLSSPEFVEFDVKEVRPEIGWKYINNKFESGE